MVTDPLPIEAHRFPKNGREDVVALLSTFEGRRVACLRVEAQGARGGRYLTLKGLTLAVEHLPALRRAVDALEQAAVSAGFLSPAA